MTAIMTAEVEESKEYLLEIIRKQRHEIEVLKKRIAYPVDLTEHSFEDLASAICKKGKKEGYPKVTDKTKWREPVMAAKLNHTAHKKISAGVGKDEYGSDAYDSKNNVYAEYKTMSLSDKDLRNLFQSKKRNGKTYAPMKVKGVYNGAYKTSAIAAYENIDHYFGVFYDEECVLIIKPRTDFVMSQLRENNAKRKPGATTNCNTAIVDLGDESTYEVAYKKESFFATS